MNDCGEVLDVREHTELSVRRNARMHALWLGVLLVSVAGHAAGAPSDAYLERDGTTWRFGTSTVERVVASGHFERS